MHLHRILVADTSTNVKSPAGPTLPRLRWDAQDVTKRFEVLPVDRERIAAARTKDGLTVRDLAARIVGADHTEIHKIERGKTRSTALLPAIYKALHLDATRINREDEDVEELVLAYKKVRASDGVAARLMVKDALERAQLAEAVENTKAELELAQRELRTGRRRTP